MAARTITLTTSSPQLSDEYLTLTDVTELLEARPKLARERLRDRSDPLPVAGRINGRLVFRRDRVVRWWRGSG